MLGGGGDYIIRSAWADGRYCRVFYVWRTRWSCPSRKFRFRCRRWSFHPTTVPVWPRSFDRNNRPPPVAYPHHTFSKNAREIVVGICTLCLQPRQKEATGVTLWQIWILMWASPCDKFWILMYLGKEWSDFKKFCSLRISVKSFSLDILL